MTRLLYSLCAEDGQRHYSPHVWKIIFALCQKGLEHELVPLSFQSLPDIENGAFKTVPVLNDGGHLASDSFEIARYLDQRYQDRPPLFNGSASLAYAHFTTWYCDRILHPALAPLLTGPMYDMMSTADRAYFRQKRETQYDKPMASIIADSRGTEAEVAKKLDPFRAVLATSEWIGGDMPTFVDHILFGTLKWWQICCPDLTFPAQDPVGIWFANCNTLISEKDINS